MSADVHVCTMGCLSDGILRTNLLLQCTLSVSFECGVWMVRMFQENEIDNTVQNKLTTQFNKIMKIQPDKMYPI